MSGEHRTVEVNKAIIVNLPKIKNKRIPRILGEQSGGTHDILPPRVGKC